MPQISKDVIDRIRDTADIVDVVSQYVDLKQKGPNLFGLCPFHAEKTPSFSVAQGKQIFYCFGCNAGGNVFSFLMDYLKISFPESIKLLAEKYGIDIKIDENRDKSEIFSSLYKLNEMAASLYQDNLFSLKGERVLDYLLRRGLSKETIEKFKIGYAKNDWNHLTNRCRGKGFSKSQIIQSGLFTHSEKGIFDRFRSRIMFPIFHASGKVIAFGGRVFESEDSAKYINSPETLLFKKSNNFYGLQATRDSIRKEGYVILVEGYMDFLKLYQSGINPILSVSGTSFSSKHALALKRLTKKIIILYDGDNAGANAAIRAGWVMLKNGLIPTVVNPPDQLDPDDWISKFGINAVKESLTSPIDHIEFHIKFNNGLKLGGVERQNYIVELANEVSGINDGIIKNDLVKIISEKLSINEKDFIRKIKTSRVNPENLNREKEKKDKSIVFNNQIDKAQVELIRIMLSGNKNQKKYILDNLDLDLFTTPILNKVAKILIDRNLDVESSKIIEYFQDDHERNYITKILFFEDRGNLSTTIVYDCLKILKSEPIKQKISLLRVQIREKELNDEDPTNELVVVNKLIKELDDIKK